MKTKFLKVLAVASTMSVLFGSVAVSAATTTTGSGDTTTKATTSQNITVGFNQKETIQLTLASSTIDFGTVTGHTSVSTTTSPTDLVASVKSSGNYDLNIVATDDFSNTTTPTATKVPVTKLGVNVDGGAFSNLGGVNTSKTLVSNASDTSALPDVTRTHTIDFNLADSIGYKSGSYTAPLTVSIIQK